MAHSFFSRSVRWKQSGFSLLETGLVLLLAGALILFGIRQYQSADVGLQVGKIRENVRVLLFSASEFKQSECHLSASGGQGVLDARGVQFATQSPAVSTIAIAIQNDLVRRLFLRESLKASPWVVGSVPARPENGYVVQMNAYRQNREIEINQRNATVKTGIQASIFVLKPQVAVHVTNPSVARALAGDCLSTADGGGTVKPCLIGANPNGDYVVFERHSFDTLADPLGEFFSPIVSSAAATAQFKAQYEQYPILSVLAVNGLSQAPNDARGTPQYLWCL